MTKHKVAIVLQGFYLNQTGHRGVASYMNYFLPNLADACILDVYCINTPYKEYPPINKIIKITKKQFEDENFLKNSDYDFIFADYNSPHFYNAELRHSHSPMYRESIVRTPFELSVKKIFDKKRLVTEEQKTVFQQNLQKLDILIANSKIAREDYIKFGAAHPDKVFILNPCIKTINEFSFTPQPKFTFGMSAVTFALKGGYTFLNALYKLKKNKNDFTAQIIYPNYPQNYILQLYVKLLGMEKNIEFLSYQKDMSDFYNSIDCLVVPSREETFGMVVLEAMTNSKPVVLSSRCGAVDIIEDNNNSWIFDYESTPDENLFEKLKMILENKDSIQVVAQKAYETAKKHNSEFHSQQLEKILNTAYERNKTK